MRVQLWRSLVTAGLLLFCVGDQVAWGDIFGRISGVAKDATGAVVPGVRVTAACIETGIKQSTQTDAQGFYAFPSLAVGHYDVNASQAGFKDFQVTGLTLDVNSALTVDIPLSVGEQSQHVSVSAAALQVETVNTQLGEVVTGSSITAVPLNGRSYTDLLALQPGVAPYASTYVGGTGAYSVSGNREMANGFVVNGGNVKEGVNMGTAILPNLDSIGEFRVLTSNFDPEYGNYSGGMVNVVTKSGSNQFHGSAFDFLRNTDLNARNFYSPGVSKYIQNQFGGTGGGPILKDKLFFFGDYQGTRRTQGQNTGAVLVPSAADRTGNILDLASQLNGTVTGDYWASQLSQKLGYGVTAGERYYVAGCTVNTSCVFPNAIIPQSVITAPSLNMIKYIPLPNSGQFYTSSSSNSRAWDDKGGIRIDLSTNRFGMLSWYYFIDDSHSFTPGTFAGFDSGTQGRSQMLTMGDTKTFGPNKVNEFRIHYMRTVSLGLAGGGIGVSLSSLGFVTGANTSGIFVQNPDVEGVPNISMSNYSFGVAAAPLAGQYNGLYQASDNFSWVKGTHTMKFGASFHYDQIIHHDYYCRNGCFGFSNGQETGSDWADYLLGAPSSYTQGSQLDLITRSRYFGAYAQDSWRISPSLTLNYGLRWDVTQPWYEQRNELETIIPGEQSVVFPGAPKGWVVPGDPGVPGSMGYTRYKDFAPRIGLAWAPQSGSGWLGKLLGGPGKTSVRAGYGIFFTAYEDAVSFNAEGDAPYGFYWASPAPPLFTTPFIDRQTGFNEGQRFPPHFPSPNASPQHPDNSIDWSQFEPIASSPGFWHENQTPYSENWNLTIQRQFGTSTVASVSYVGSEGHHLISNLEANPGDPALCLSVSQKSQVAPGSAVCGPNGENGVYTRADGTVINGTRGPLGPAFASDGYYITIGNSNYHSMQASLRHHSGPLEMMAGFTWSKSIDDSSGWSQMINPLNYRLSRTLSTFDVPKNFVLSYNYELPFAHLFGRNRIARGWILTGITRFASGIPITLSDSGDRSLLGTGSAGAGSAVDRPNCSAGGDLQLGVNDPRTRLTYFNKSIFSREIIGQFGTCNQRFFHGPGLNNFDMALLKDLRITESKILQFRFEFFNVFNHTQFNNPSGSVTSATFGIVTSARSARVGQLAMKFLF
jgi:Carboxypeptidase regulatory-like domain